jgi:hypothetical protein
MESRHFSQNDAKERILWAKDVVKSPGQEGMREKVRMPQPMFL